MTVEIFHDQSRRKYVADPGGVEPATSWSPVGRRIQLSHRSLWHSCHQNLWLKGRSLFSIQSISLFWMAMAPRGTSHGAYTSYPNRIARASSTLRDFYCHDKGLTAKLLRQGYRYFKLRKVVSKFYLRHSALVEIYNVSLKRLQQAISEPEFYDDLVNRFWKQSNLALLYLIWVGAQHILQDCMCAHLSNRRCFAVWLSAGCPTQFD